MTLFDHAAHTRLHETSIPVLKTKRLMLRAPRLEDAETIAALANDRWIAENTARIPYPYRPSDAEQFVSSANQALGEPTWLIVLKDARVIGACDLTYRGEAAPELGYWLGLGYWGHGYAAEAARAVIDYAFTDLGHESLGAGTRITNPASRRVLEQCGFEWTGVGLCHIRALSSSVPIDRFRLERGIWASLKR
jgi:RimJ/RimL family protein N-acetyltransferase